MLKLLELTGLLSHLAHWLTGRVATGTNTLREHVSLQVCHTSSGGECLGAARKVNLLLVPSVFRRAKHCTALHCTARHGLPSTLPTPTLCSRPSKEQMLLLLLFSFPLLPLFLPSIDRRKSYAEEDRSARLLPSLCDSFVLHLKCRHSFIF